MTLIFHPLKSSWEKKIETAFVFPALNLRQTKYIEMTLIFLPIEIPYIKSIEMTWKFIDIFFATSQHNIDIKSTSFRRGVSHAYSL